MNTTFSHGLDTFSLCPVCFKRLNAKRVTYGQNVYLEKECPEHGAFKALIWQGEPEMAGWRRPKIPTRPEKSACSVENGCPFDCGLCPEHQQRSCTIIFEVTRRCNLNCRFCFADAGKNTLDPTARQIAEWYRQAKIYGGQCNIQLSGGEPTLRNDLAELVYLGRRSGFDFIQINTNGLRLAKEPEFARALKEAGTSSIFMQFDGTDDAIYKALRGRPLWDLKQAALDACRKADLAVVLVPTLVPGVNTHTLAEILKEAVSWYPTVRGVHFQPVSYFGRHTGEPQDHQRLTLPALMRLLEDQTEGMLNADHFRPPGCEHSLCSFNAQYLVSEDETLQPLNADGASWRNQAPIPACKGAQRAIASVARQWSNARLSGTGCGCKLDYSLPDASAPMSLDGFLAMAQSRTFSVSAMAFQDAWNLDLERARQCCIHVMGPNGRLIPFCLYNVTAQDGHSLYRP